MSLGFYALTNKKILPIKLLANIKIRKDSLVIQWLRLHGSTAGGTG